MTKGDKVDIETSVTVKNKDKVLVYDFELAETIERKGRVRK